MKMLFYLPSLSLLNSKHIRQIFPLTHSMSSLALSKVELVAQLLMSQVLSLINVGSLVGAPVDRRANHRRILPPGINK